MSVKMKKPGTQVVHDPSSSSTNIFGSADRHQPPLVKKQELVARFLRGFSSARKRSGLTADEVLIFFAIGHLSASALRDIVLVRPVKLVDVAVMLNIPKETVRRKSMRLVDIDYVSMSREGVRIRQLDVWIRMFESIID
jgi:hypothetical protein